MDIQLALSLAAIVLLVAASGFFAGAETALTAVSRARIYHLVMEGNKRAAIVSRLRARKEELIGTLLLGNTAVHVAGSALATSVAIQMLGQQGVAVVAVVMTMAVVVFGEVMPKTYAIQHAERCALAIAPLVLFLLRVFYPATRLVQAFNRLVLRLFSVNMTDQHSLISASDVIRGTIELHHREGEMVKQDRDMLGSILDLNDIEVQDIMIHRKNIETIDASLPAEEIIREAVGSTHSRIPLWRDEQDNIVGVLHVKNLIRAMNKLGNQLTVEEILAICSKPWFIPETTSLREQLLAFRQRRQHFALVVDEYGALLGIVTLEDIIEEIVGEIDDEHDKAEASGIAALGQGWYAVDGLVTIRDLNRQLDWSLPDEHASTIAGLVIHEARLIPEVGATFEFHGCRFVVEEKSASQITRVRVQKLVEDAPKDTVE